eukprot:4962902-Amphidinium_carterae.1
MFKVFLNACGWPLREGAWMLAMTITSDNCSSYCTCRQSATSLIVSTSPSGERQLKQHVEACHSCVSLRSPLEAFCLLGHEPLIAESFFDFGTSPRQNSLGQNIQKGRHCSRIKLIASIPVFKQSKHNEYDSMYE